MAEVANVHRKSLLGIRLLEFAFEQPLASRPAKRVTRSPRSNLWHPLLEQEFAFREETVEITVKYNQNNYAKAEVIIAVQA